MNNYALEGKTAIITGAAGGIGIAIARLMLESVASVSLWDRSAEGLARATSAFASGSKLRQQQLDITDEHAVAAAVANERAAGRIDVLVNNAGILGEVKPVWEVGPADFRKVMEVNLVGAFLCARAVLAAMRDQDPRPNRGHIVNIASIQGKEGMALAAAYSASKAGLIALTKTIGKEVAADRIYANCITPSAATGTSMSQEISEERRKDILGRIPVGRFVEVEEIARLTAWLASDDCSFSTAAVFDISGGRATY